MGPVRGGKSSSGSGASECPDEARQYRRGDVQIITTSEAKMSGAGSWLQVAAIFLGLALPSFALMTLATLVATPMVVRRAIASLDEAAQYAATSISTSAAPPSAADCSG